MTLKTHPKSLISSTWQLVTTLLRKWLVSTIQAAFKNLYPLDKTLLPPKLLTQMEDSSRRRMTISTVPSLIGTFFTLHQTLADEIQWINNWKGRSPSSTMKASMSTTRTPRWSSSPSSASLKRKGISRWELWISQLDSLSESLYTRLIHPKMWAWRKFHER